MGLKKIKTTKLHAKLKVSEIPHGLAILNRLEIDLISKRLLFKKLQSCVEDKCQK